MKTIQDEATFSNIVNNDETSIIKFYTNWCPDCRRMDMFIDEIIETHSNFGWFQLNKDEIPEIAAKHEVMGIPSLLVFKNGEKIGHLHSANAKSPEEVLDFLKSF